MFWSEMFIGHFLIWTVESSAGSSCRPVSLPYNNISTSQLGTQHTASDSHNIRVQTVKILAAKLFGTQLDLDFLCLF